MRRRRATVSRPSLLAAAAGPACRRCRRPRADCAADSSFEAALAADPDNLRPRSEYRQGGDRRGEYDRAIDFFEKLVTDHPQAANAWLNYGYAYVDKIPAAGSITQVILANTRADPVHASRSSCEQSWLALFTRGNSYLYWPKIFGRAPLGVADLEKAVAHLARRSRRSESTRAPGSPWATATGRPISSTRRRRSGRRGCGSSPASRSSQARLGARGRGARGATSTSSSIPTSGSTPNLRSLVGGAVKDCPSAALLRCSRCRCARRPARRRGRPRGRCASRRSARRRARACAHHTRKFTGQHADVLGMFTSGGAAVGRRRLRRRRRRGPLRHRLRRRAGRTTCCATTAPGADGCRASPTWPRRRGSPAATMRDRSSPTPSGSTPTTTGGRTCWWPASARRSSTATEGERQVRGRVRRLGARQVRQHDRGHRLRL